MGDSGELSEEDLLEILQSTNDLLNEFRDSDKLGTDDEILAPPMQRALDEQIEKVRNALLSKNVRDAPNFADVLECHSHLTDLWIQRVGKPAMCALDKDKDGTVTQDELAGDAVSEERDLLNDENRELMLINESLAADQSSMALRVEQLTTALNDSEQRVAELTRDLNHLTEEHHKAMSDVGSPAVIISGIDPGDGKDLEEDDIVLSPTIVSRPEINKDIKSMEEEVESLELELKQERKTRMAELTLAEKQRIFLDTQVQTLTKTLVVLRMEMKQLTSEVDTLNNDIDVFIAELIEKDNLIEQMEIELNNFRIRASTHHVGFADVGSQWSVVSAGDITSLEDQMDRMKDKEEFEIGSGKKTAELATPRKDFHVRQASQSVMINQNMSAMCLARLKSAQSTFTQHKFERMDSTKMFESLKQQYEMQHSVSLSATHIGSSRSLDSGSVVRKLLAEDEVSSADLGHIPEDQDDVEFDGKLTGTSPSYSLSTTPYDSPKKGGSEGEEEEAEEIARTRSQTDTELEPDMDENGEPLKTETGTRGSVIVAPPQPKTYETCSLIEVEAANAKNAQLQEKNDELEERIKQLISEKEKTLAQMRDLQDRTRDSYVNTPAVTADDDSENQALLANRRSSSTNNIDVVDDKDDSEAVCVCFSYRLW